MDEKSNDASYVARKSRFVRKPPFAIVDQWPISGAHNIPIQSQNLEYGSNGEVQAANDEIAIKFRYDLDPDDSNRRILNEYMISNPAGDQSLELVHLLPDGWRISFDPIKNWDHTGNGHADFKQRKVTIPGINPTSPEFITTVLHEIGHVRDDSIHQVFDANNRLRSREALSIIESAQIIKAERVAWAFALRTIKPFIDFNPQSRSGFSWANVWDHVHDKALQSYTRRIQNGIQAPLLDEFTPNKVAA